MGDEALVSLVFQENHTLFISWQHRGTCSAEVPGIGARGALSENYTGGAQKAVTRPCYSVSLPFLARTMTTWFLSGQTQTLKAKCFPIQFSKGYSSCSTVYKSKRCNQPNIHL